MPTTQTRHVRQSPGAGEFSTLSAALSDIVTAGDNDLVTDDKIQEIVVHGSATVYDTTAVAINSADYTTDATRYIDIVHGGESDPYVLGVSGFNVMKVEDEYVRIRGTTTAPIVIRQTEASSGSQRHGFQKEGSGASSEVIMEKVRIEATGTLTGFSKGLYTSGQGIITARNCVVRGWGGGSSASNVFADNPASTITLENCTVHGGWNNIQEDGGTLNATNTRGTGDTGGSDWVGSLSSGSHNLSEDATALGTSAQINATVSYTDAANGDFSLQSGDDGIDNGTDLSPDVTDDFEGTSRPQGSVYDIGAYERVQAGGGSTPAGTYYHRFLGAA